MNEPGPGLRWQCVVVTLGLSCSADVLASVDICGDPPTDKQISLGIYKQQRSDFDQSPGDIAQEGYEVDLSMNHGSRWSYGVGHRYKAMRVDGFALQTNGHLHTTYFPIHRQSRNGANGYRISIAPTLSGSSNVMKDPGNYTTDTVQVLAAVVFDRRLSGEAGIRYGVCADHRFGSFRIYPMVGIDWRPGADWIVMLGYPASAISYEAHQSFKSSLLFGPDGNEWHVRNRNRDNESQLRYESYLLEWIFEWRWKEHLAVTTGFGIEYRNRYTFALSDNSRVNLSSDSASRLRIALGWRF